MEIKLQFYNVKFRTHNDLDEKKLYRLTDFTNERSQNIERSKRCNDEEKAKGRQDHEMTERQYRSQKVNIMERIGKKELQICLSLPFYIFNRCHTGTQLMAREESTQQAVRGMMLILMLRCAYTMLFMLLKC